MKKVPVWAAAAAVGLVASAATADGVFEYEVLECPNTFFGVHTTAFGDDPVNEFGLLAQPNASAIVGIKIDFYYDEVDEFGNPALDSSWASDLGMVINIDGFTIGFGGTFRNLGALAGGYTLAQAEAAVDVYGIWDFNGSQSDLPGSYSHEYMFDGFYLSKPELFWVQMTDTWNGNTLYEGFSITLIKKPLVPAPGAGVLLAIAGFAGTRRRRA